MKGTTNHTKDTNRDLPPGWRWVKLGEVCELNPRRPQDFKRAADSPTTFVPMSAVDGLSGTITRAVVKPFAEVCKGYTWFAESDVLFAKITPCMQNGKQVIATGLIDGIGFGTTEFHVLRPGKSITAEWIHLFVRQPAVLQEATNHFTGAVGQQRLPDDYLRTLQLPLPPLSEQRRIAAILTEQMAALERARQAAEAQMADIKALPAAYLRAVFDSEEAKKWEKKRLGEVMRLRKEVVYPRDAPSGPATFVGLEHIESATGKRVGAIFLEMSELEGRKPRFHKGDIVYGYLRPYLNKMWIAEFDGLCSVDQYVYSIVCEIADTQFVAWFMRSPVYLKRAPIETTPGQLPRIRTEEVASVELNLPPLKVQRRIAAELSEWMAGVEKLRSQLEAQLAEIKALPTALLREAFSGEL